LWLINKHGFTPGKNNNSLGALRWRLHSFSPFAICPARETFSDGASPHNLNS
jgi:hypothetical protein